MKKNIWGGALIAALLVANLVPAYALQLNTNSDAQVNTSNITPDGLTPAQTEVKATVVDGGNLLIATVPMEISFEFNTWGEVVTPTLTIENNTDDKKIRVYEMVLVNPTPGAGGDVVIADMDDWSDTELLEFGPGSDKYFLIDANIAEQNLNMKSGYAPSNEYYDTFSNKYAAGGNNVWVGAKVSKDISPSDSLDIDFTVKASKSLYATVTDEPLDIGKLVFVIGNID